MGDFLKYALGGLGGFFLCKIIEDNKVSGNQSNINDVPNPDVSSTPNPNPPQSQNVNPEPQQPTAQDSSGFSEPNNVSTI